MAFSFLRKMSLPVFYVPDLSDKKVVMDEDASRHMISVLRMQKGKEILLTDGKGKKATAIISDDNRKKVVVNISAIATEETKKNKVAIGISLIKNPSRFEWFLEKATEIGVSEIIPLICERTEKEKFRLERLQNILTSAMLQSQQSWMPLLHEPRTFLSVASQNDFDLKYIAHCAEDKKENIQQGASALMLIGPEGDFTSHEIEMAIQNNFIPVTLGETRLRTETAGIVAATLLMMK
jgi:16S rRNA (uracil1498-N3)-methyltransferase